MFVKIKENLYCETRMPWPKVRFNCQQTNENTIKLIVTVFNKISKTNQLIWSIDIVIDSEDTQNKFTRAETSLYEQYLQVLTCEHLFQPTHTNSLLECMGSAACKKCSLILDNYFMDKRTFDSMKLSEFAHRDQKRKYSGEPYFNHPKSVYCKVYSAFKAHKMKPEIVDLFCACFEHDIKEDCPEITAEKIIEVSGQNSYNLVLEVTNPSINYPDLPREKRIEMNCIHLEGVSVFAKIIKMADRICNLKDMRLCPDIKWIDNYQRETELLIKHLKNGLRNQRYVEYKDEVGELFDELCFISNKVKHLVEMKENFFIEIPKDVG